MFAQVARAARPKATPVEIVNSLSVTVASYLRDTKLSLENRRRWREDCCITRSGLEHRRW
jgi:hypothetical protein